MTLLQITDDRERAIRLCELHKQWKPTMEVSVWGRGKASRTDQQNCPDKALVGKEKYPGNCDECLFCMGVRFEENRTYYWGDYAKACCALELEAEQDSK